jgi:alpha-tubulin suppressor-like RCC1 family protein
MFRGAERVVQVSCGDTHSMLLTAEGLVYAFGNNSGKQLGIKNAPNDVKVPTLVEDLLSDTMTPKVTSICCANSFTVAVTNSG